MKLDIGSFMFNMNVYKHYNTKGATSAWGTELGQDKEHKIKLDDEENMMKSLVYTCVEDKENVKCFFGKGKKKVENEDYIIVLAGLYNKVYVNNELVEGAQFLLVVEKELKTYHAGRLSIKYGPNMEYRDKSINDECFKLIKKQLKLNDNSAWFVNEMTIRNQDELHFKAYIADKDKEMKFYSPDERKEFVNNLVYSKEDLTIDELADILKEYKQKCNNVDTGLHLFGIKYAKWLNVNKDKINELLEKSESVQNLRQEIKKGVNLSPYVTIKEYDEYESDNKSKWDVNQFITGYENKQSRNRIIFGAPGTGKSFDLNKDIEKLLGEGNESDFERVTFHPDYSYANFVGTYKPEPYKKADNTEGITYKYVPGPFMRLYVKAMKNIKTSNVKPYLLIIEEINRANVAAVFGDVFQLLDRNEKNISEFPIETSKEMRDYLCRELGEGNYEKICLPDNMFIWATMNSADQGVFPMDTAFKRRWDFEYKGIDNNEEMTKGKVVLGKGKKQCEVEWNELRKAINNRLSELGINEDKLLGPFFISKKIIDNKKEDGNIEETEFIKAFKNKVLMYLYEDAAKQKRKELFFKPNLKYSELCDKFDEIGIHVFCEDIVKSVIGNKDEDEAE